MWDEIEISSMNTAVNITSHLATVLCEEANTDTVSQWPVTPVNMQCPYEIIIDEGLVEFE